MMVMRLFELPVQISLPLYSLERPANPQPLAYLVLQADSYRMYKFVMSWVVTLVTTCLLMTLILSVALTWCINRLIVHPLRRIARELNALAPQDQMGHQLELPACHRLYLREHGTHLANTLCTGRPGIQTDNRYPVRFRETNHR